jgi:redox-sensitive bicupin YhaK (pirin superfamily)
MAPPRYNGIAQALIPAVREDGVTVRVISGVYKGVFGATRGDYVRPQFLDVTLLPNAQWQGCAKDGCARAHTDDGTLFVYVLSGSGRFGPEPGETVEAKHAALFGEGNVLRVAAGKEGMRFLLLCGQPLREPIAWGGPIVMNTPAELRLAFKEIDEGTFIKHRA